ncbi:MAG: M1 family metallopeptidase, partial [Planctomycetota bacterium]|nr:M1 family metallopeptidase [Planctomycetota bacterium]
MARKGPFAAALCVLLTFGADRTSLQADLRERSERVVHYTIEAELLPKEKVVRGQMDLVWRNPSSVPVDHIYVHLYLNAFKDRDSTYMRESEGAGKAGATWDKRHPGFIEIASMTREDGVELWTDENRAFVAPDDGNEKDRTLAHVKLPAPVQPGETLTLAVKWRSQLPRVVHRTGWAGDPDDPGNMFFMVAQWFPKIAVLRDGIWNAHQFHKNTEWFSDYGVYQVALTVPKGYVVGATGTRSVRRENGDGKITVVHRQEDVHDFTWTASPRFRVFERRWTFDSFCESSGAMGTRIRDLLDRTAKHLGVEPDTIKPQREVDVRILYQEDHEELVDRIWAATGASLACYGIWFGQYPYPVLTVVDPPAGGMAAGGMEYPTLFSIYSDRLAPTYATGLEGVTIHEFGHQFFYGLIATNEFEEAWLDEGFTSFTDARTFQEAYGASTATTRYRPLYLARRRPFEAPRVFGRIAKLLALERWLGKIPHPWSKPDSFTPVPGANPVWDYLRDMPALHFDADVTVPAPFGERNRVIGTKSQDAMVMHGWDFASRRDYGVNSYAK